MKCTLHDQIVGGAALFAHFTPFFQKWAWASIGIEFFGFSEQDIDVVYGQNHCIGDFYDTGTSGMTITTQKSCIFPTFSKLDT